MTKVLVVNGSPNMEKGMTATVLEPFLEGMREAGAQIDLYYATRIKITPCVGDFQCWFEKPGECQYHDEMYALYPKLREAEILVLATPVYIPLPSKFQDFLNRLCPLIEPMLTTRDGRTRARLHKDVSIRKMALVSTGGWWELENLDLVGRIVEELAETMGVEFSGAVLRPHAFLLEQNEEAASKVFGAIRRAGHSLVSEGRMAEEDLRIVSEPLVDREALRQRYNRTYTRAAGGRQD